MPYWVHISDEDRNYLNHLPLSATARETVEDFIEYAIAHVDDEFRNDPANRTQPDTRYFQRQFLLLDRWEGGDQRFHRLDFVVNDQNASQGILIVVYVEHQ